MAKADRPKITPPRKPVEALHHPGEPERLCGNCEHFKPTRVTAASSRANVPGVCHNGISGRFTSSAKDLACLRGFYPETKRFPLHERLGVLADFVAGQKRAGG